MEKPTTGKCAKRTKASLQVQPPCMQQQNKKTSKPGQETRNAKRCHWASYHTQASSSAKFVRAHKHHGPVRCTQISASSSVTPPPLYDSRAACCGERARPGSLNTQALHEAAKKSNANLGSKSTKSSHKHNAICICKHTPTALAILNVRMIIHRRWTQQGEPPLQHRAQAAPNPNTSRTLGSAIPPLSKYLAMAPRWLANLWRAHA